jgi:hypothetical protein
MVDETGKEQECYPFDEDDEIEETAQKHFLELLNSKGVLSLLVRLIASGHQRIGQRYCAVLGLLHCYDAKRLGFQILGLYPISFR